VENSDMALLFCHLVIKPDLVFRGNISNNYRGTALHLSAGEGHLDICRLLLQSKADPQLKDE
jgi:ankyrin repeat protein